MVVITAETLVLKSKKDMLVVIQLVLHIMKVFTSFLWSLLFSSSIKSGDLGNYQ